MIDETEAVAEATAFLPDDRSERITIHYHELFADGTLSPASVSFSRPLHVSIWDCLEAVVKAQKAVAAGDYKICETLDSGLPRRTLAQFIADCAAAREAEKELEPITHAECNQCGWLGDYQSLKDNPDHRSLDTVLCPDCDGWQLNELTTTEAKAILAEYGKELPNT